MSLHHPGLTAIDLSELIDEDLRQHGLPDLLPSGDGYRCCAWWRDGDNPAVVQLSAPGPLRDHWFWYDHKTQDHGYVVDYVLITSRATNASEAYEWLGQRYGLSFGPPLSTEERAERNRQHRRHKVAQEMMIEAADYLHKQLPNKARGWLRKHWGLTDETIDYNRIGFYNGNLDQHLQEWLEERYPITEEKVTDLLAEQRSYRQLPSEIGLVGAEAALGWHRRIVFWYGDQHGMPVNATARRCPRTPGGADGPNKYLRLPSTDFIDNRVFCGEWCLADAKAELPLLVVEGVTDVLAVHQAGYPAVGVSSASVPRKNVERLKNIAKRFPGVVIIADAESSGTGEAGAINSAAHLHPECSVSIVAPPRLSEEAKVDIADYLRQADPEDAQQRLAELLDLAKPYPQHLLQQVPADTPNSELDRALKPALTAIIQSGAAAREGYIKQISDRFGIGISIARALLKEAPPPKVRQVQEAALVGCVHEAKDHYYRLNKKGEHERISSWVLRPEAWITAERQAYLRAEMVSMSDQLKPSNVILPRSAFSGAGALRNSLDNRLLQQWSGSDANVEGLLACLADHHPPMRKGTTKLGRHELDDGPVWMLPDRVLTPTGQAEHREVRLEYIDDSDGWSLNCPHTPSHRLDKLNRLTRRALPLLPEVHPMAWPILGWFFACPWRWPITERSGSFPILMVWGPKGGGKTSLARMFARLMGLDHLYAANKTPFSHMRMMASSLGVPYVMDEYDPQSMKGAYVEPLNNLLRLAYNGAEDQRGNPDKTLTPYRLTAPVAMVGERVPTVESVVERIAMVRIPERAIEDHHADTYRQLQQMHLERLVEPYLRWSLTADWRSAYDHVRERVDRQVAAIYGTNARNVKPRCRDNLAAVCMGMTMYRTWATSMDIDVPKIPSSVIGEMLAETHGLSGRVRSLLDDFVSAIATLAFTGQIPHAAYHRYRSGNRVGIHIASCVNAYLSQSSRPRTAERPEAFEKAIRQAIADARVEPTGYVIDTSVAVDTGRRPDGSRSTARMVVIDLKVAREAIPGLSDFPEQEPHDDRFDI